MQLRIPGAKETIHNLGFGKNCGESLPNVTFSRIPPIHVVTFIGKQAYNNNNTVLIASHVMEFIKPNGLINIPGAPKTRF